MDEERKKQLQTLKETPAQLRAALSGVPKKLLLFRPAPGKWSIQEIVCHLRDMERDAYLTRYRRILGEDNPKLPDIDGDFLALVGDYRSLNVRETLRDWAGLRKECLKLLRGVKAGDWRRVGIHETAGPLSMDDLLRRHAVGNDLAHVGQIEAIKKRWTLLERLEAGPDDLARATRLVAAEAARTRPASGKWSIVENVCHLRDVEQVFVERFSKMAYQDRPHLWVMDNDDVAVRRRYAATDLGAAVKDYRRLREETLILLRALPEAMWQRTGIHPSRGEVTIGQLAQVLTDHDESHIGRVRALAA